MRVPLLVREKHKHPEFSGLEGFMRRDQYEELLEASSSTFAAARALIRGNE